MIMILVKYKTLVICPIDSYGGSTGFAPIHVRIANVLVRNQKFIFLFGENFLLLVFLNGRIARIAIAIARAMTPPSFDGIDRKIA